MSRHQASILARAPASDINSCAFRHSSREPSLSPSMRALSVAFPAGLSPALRHSRTPGGRAPLNEHRAIVDADGPGCAATRTDPSLLLTFERVLAVRPLALATSQSLLDEACKSSESYGYT